MKDVDDEWGTATYLGKPVKTLQQWRWKREGPAYIKVGRAVRYRRADVERWLDEQTVLPADATNADRGQ